MSRAKGNDAERFTSKHLEEQGFTILICNYYTRFGEIDIIARRDEVLHFIEVKSGLDYERAVQNMTPQKIGRILKSVDVYLKHHGLACHYQIDAAIVSGGSCTLIESITL
ncbi:MAG: YraN family protein [Campylobacterales bacterium]|nr:YraN family protein [Campylobacterales bacterium]